MLELKPYDIPDDIQDIEFEADAAKFEMLESLIPESRSNEANYIKLLSAMVHLEDAANSGRVRRFNLRNIQLIYESQNDNIFAIELDVSKTTIFIRYFVKIVFFYRQTCQILSKQFRTRF